MKKFKGQDSIGVVVRWFCRKFQKWSVWNRIDHCRRFIKDGANDDWGRSADIENDRIRLPSDEGVQIPVITIVELYTPSQAIGLLDGIVKLGWQRGKTQSVDLMQWAEEVRQNRSAGSINLGLVGAKTNKHPLVCERIADLPVGVHAAFPVLTTLTPSITALVMSFFLDDEAAAKLNGPLHSSYTSYSEADPSFRWWNIGLYILFGRHIRFSRTIHLPMNQQRDAVEACVSALENSCAQWVRDYLPGAFSSGVRGKSLPSAILFLTEKTEFIGEARHYHSAFDGLGINKFFTAWQSEEWPSVKMFMPASWDNPSMRLAFACSRGNAFPENSMYVEQKSNWTIAYRAHEKILGLVTRWSLSCLLDGYHEQLSRLRDQSAIDGSHRTIRDLKRLRHLVRTLFYDIVTSAHEIDDFAKSNSSYHFDVLNVERAESASRGGKKFYLLNGLQSAQRERARQLHREADLLQSLLSVSSDLSQTITNINIQRSIIFLTVTSIAIGAITLWVTIRPPH